MKKRLLSHATILMLREDSEEDDRYATSGA
jgi:hypothetical protein